MVCIEKLVCAPAIETRRALTAHGLDVVAVVEVRHGQPVVGIVGYPFDLEPSRSSQIKATAVPELVAISQPRLDPVLEELVASAVANELTVDSALVEEVHKTFVGAVEVSLVLILLPFSPLLSSLILQHFRLLWAVLPIAVDSSRRCQYSERRGHHQLINI